jgi:hypothetical protein
MLSNSEVYRIGRKRLSQLIPEAVESLRQKNDLEPVVLVA